MITEEKYKAHLHSSVEELFKAAKKINNNSKIKLKIDDMGIVNSVMMDVINNFIANLIAQLYCNQSDAVIQYNLDTFYKRLHDILKASVAHYRELGINNE